MLSIKKELENRSLDVLQEAAEKVRHDLKIELIGQGHVLTGDLLRSITVSKTSTTDEAEANILMNDYFNVVNTGVRANRIPYRGRGNGGKSKYIQGLIRFWKIKKGLGEKEATRAAFALANKHKKEGMFTANSRKFAAFKRRFKFFNRTTDDNKDINKVVDKLENVGTDVANLIIDQFILDIK